MSGGKRRLAASMLVLVGCIVLLLSAFAVGGVAGASADELASTGNQSESDVEIAPAVASADGTTELVIRLEDRSFEETGAAKAHAATVQAPIEKLAASEPGLDIEHQFWVTNAVVVTVDTDRVPIERIAGVDGVERLHPNFAVELEGSATAASSPGGESVFNPPGASVPGPRPGSTGAGAADVAGVDTTASEAVDTTASGAVGATYGLEQIGAPETWAEYDTRGAGATVAVLDTGVDASHEDVDLYTEDPDDETYPGGWAEFDSSGTLVSDSVPHDDDGHGTHVSGTVAGGAASGRHIGVAPDATLLHGQVLPDGSGSFAQIVGGMEWAIENDADAISMSLGVTGHYSDFLDPIRTAESQGAVVVASIGNSGEGLSSVPGNEYDSVGVGATDAGASVTTFSGGKLVATDDDWGSDAPADWPAEYVVPAVTAPGASVESSVPGGGYGSKSGTSMAAPHVAGTVALVQSATDEHLPPAETRAAIETSARKPDDWDESDADASLDGRDTRYGAGIVDVPATIAGLQDDSSPEFGVVDASLAEETVLEGEPVTATATVENTGDGGGEFTADLLVDGRVVDTANVAVGAGDSESVSLDTTVEESGSYELAVSGEPAGTLTVESPATFEISEAAVDPTTIAEGGTVQATATVSNVGDREGIFSAELAVDGRAVATRRVPVTAGDSEVVAFERTFEAAGEYDLAISDTAAGTVTVETPATIDVTAASVRNASILEGETAAVDATVENTGDREGTSTVTLEIDGDAVDTRAVTVAGGATEQITFQRGFDVPGTYEVAVDGEPAGTLSVEETAAAFSVSDVELTEPVVLEGENGTVAATVENVGNEAGTYTATFVANRQTVFERSISLGPGESRRVSLQHRFDAAGEYAVAFGDTAAGTLTVEAPATFEVAEAAVEPTTILEGETARATATVTNEGDREGTFTAELSVDGRAVATRAVTVAGGDSGGVAFERTFEGAGEYDLAISDTPAGTVTVEAPASVDVTAASVRNASILEGESATVTATVENTGDRAGEFTAELLVDGTVRDTESVTVAGGAAEDVSLGTAIEEPGEYEVAVGDVSAGTVTVRPRESEFVLSGVQPHRSVVADGETVALSATVENVGTAADDVTVSASVNGDVVSTITVGLKPGENETVTIDVDTAAEGLDPGAHEVTIAIPNWEETTTITVERSLVTYADDGVVRSDGVMRAIDDWRAGRIDSALLSEVIDAWRSGTRLR